VITVRLSSPTKVEKNYGISRNLTNDARSSATMASVTLIYPSIGSALQIFSAFKLCQFIVCCTVINSRA